MRPENLAGHRPPEQSLPRCCFPVPAIERDEDPDLALAVIMGEQRGYRPWACICLADAMRHGDYPAGWTPRR